MKHKLVIILALLLILSAVAFMVKDFFYDSDDNLGNPYEYELSELKVVDKTQLCYSEVNPLKLNMEKLKGITLDSKNRVYITGKDKVVIYDQEGNLVQNFEIEGVANCIAVGHQGEIFLGMSDHIEVFDFSGNLQAKWEAPNEKSLFTSVAIGDSSVYCADAGNKMVYEYTLAGEMLKEIGRRNRDAGELGFIIPSPYFDLLLGREGELWVVNPGMHTFQSYDQQGEMVSSWKRTSMQLDGFSGCCNPSHIAMLSNGSFVTSEKGIERVKIHLPSGEFSCVVASPDQFDAETVGLDIAVDTDDRIYVLDPKRKLVRIYEELALQEKD